MSVVAVCSLSGSPGATTTSLLLAASVPAGTPVVVAECDTGGGDVAAWAQLPVSPGWATAAASTDRSLPGLLRHAQLLPSGLRVITAPARASEARVAVAEAAGGFGDLLASSEVLTVADCGRVGADPPVWASAAVLALVVLRQSTAAATVALVERTVEALIGLRRVVPRVGVVLIGSGPYRPSEVERALGVSLFAVLPEDRAGAALAAGGWSLSGRADRSALGQAAPELAQAVLAATAVSAEPPVVVGGDVGG